MSCIIKRKSRASIRGKFRHCQTYMRHFSHRRNKLHSHHETHFHTKKVVTIRIPSFEQTRSDGKTKKRLHFKSLALLKQTRLITQTKPCIEMMQLLLYQINYPPFWTWRVLGLDRVPVQSFSCFAGIFLCFMTGLGYKKNSDQEVF